MEGDPSGNLWRCRLRVWEVLSAGIPGIRRRAGCLLLQSLPDCKELRLPGLRVFFASTFWKKLQNIFGECCISKLEKVAKPQLAAVLPVV